MLLLTPWVRFYLQGDGGRVLRNISIDQTESKRVVAIIGHLRQIERSVVTQSGQIVRPLLADQAELLLASASLRALFFDDTPSPLLIEFISHLEIPVYVETLEIDSSMLLLSELESGSVAHISDFFARILLDPNVRGDFKLDERRPFATVMQEGRSVLDSVNQKAYVWAPGPESLHPADTSIGYQENMGLFQFSHITRKLVSLQDWGDVRIGYLKDIPIRRRNIICYVANKLGGVHYDSKRVPRDRADAREFSVLASAYDWEAQAVMHAGLVAIALTCIELVRVTALMNLHDALEDFHSKRQKRLMAGYSLPVPPKS